MGHNEGIFVRLPPEVKAAAERVAEADSRSTASLLRKLLIEFLRKQDATPRKRGK